MQKFYRALRDFLKPSIEKLVLQRKKNFLKIGTTFGKLAIDLKGSTQAIKGILFEFTVNLMQVVAPNWYFQIRYPNSNSGNWRKVRGTLHFATAGHSLLPVETSILTPDEKFLWQALRGLFMALNIIPVCYNNSARRLLKRAGNLFPGASPLILRSNILHKFVT